MAVNPNNRMFYKLPPVMGKPHIFKAENGFWYVNTYGSSWPLAHKAALVCQLRNEKIRNRLKGM
jgi:hypothetical protein